MSNLYQKGFDFKNAMETLMTLEKENKILVRCSTGGTFKPDCPVETVLEDLKGKVIDLVLEEMKKPPYTLQFTLESDGKYTTFLFKNDLREIEYRIITWWRFYS